MIESAGSGRQIGCAEEHTPTSMESANTGALTSKELEDIADRKEGELNRYRKLVGFEDINEGINKDNNEDNNEDNSLYRYNNPTSLLNPEGIASSPDLTPGEVSDFEARVMRREAELDLPQTPFKLLRNNLLESCQKSRLNYKYKKKSRKFGGAYIKGTDEIILVGEHNKSALQSLLSYYNARSYWFNPQQVAIHENNHRELAWAISPNIVVRSVTTKILRLSKLITLTSLILMYQIPVVLALKQHVTAIPKNTLFMKLAESDNIETLFRASAALLLMTFAAAIVEIATNNSYRGSIAMLSEVLAFSSERVFTYNNPDSVYTSMESPLYKTPTRRNSMITTKKEIMRVVKKEFERELMSAEDIIKAYLLNNPMHLNELVQQRYSDTYNRLVKEQTDRVSILKALGVSPLEIARRIKEIEVVTRGKKGLAQFEAVENALNNMIKSRIQSNPNAFGLTEEQVSALNTELGDKTDLRKSEVGGELIYRTHLREYIDNLNLEIVLLQESSKTAFEIYSKDSQPRLLRSYPFTNEPTEYIYLISSSQRQAILGDDLKLPENSRLVVVVKADEFDKETRKNPKHKRSRNERMHILLVSTKSGAPIETDSIWSTTEGNVNPMLLKEEIGTEMNRHKHGLKQLAREVLNALPRDDRQALIGRFQKGARMRMARRGLQDLTIVNQRNRDDEGFEGIMAEVVDEYYTNRDLARLFRRNTGFTK